MLGVFTEMKCLFCNENYDFKPRVNERLFQLVIRVHSTLFSRGVICLLLLKIEHKTYIKTYKLMTMLYK